MFKKYLLALVLLTGLTMSASAQQTYKQFVIGNSHIVPLQSKITGRDHELIVILPASYESNPDKKYPVLYFLDGYWDAPLVSATYGHLIYDNVVPEFIMVGLSYPSTADYGKERMLDYTFPPGDERKGGNLFLEHIKDEVAPLIETTFRGLPTDRVISGSSIAGLFVVAAAYKEPGLFAGHIAISPAAGHDKNMLARLDAIHAKDKKPLHARMFVSYGTEEYHTFRDPIIQFQKQIAARKYPGFALMNYTMQGLDHTGVKGDGYARGLSWIWKAKKPAGPSGLERGMTEKK